MDSETEKFKRWYEQEKEKGLVDIKFFGGNASEATPEEFCRELNLVIEKIEKKDFLPREDVF